MDAFTSVPIFDDNDLSAILNFRIKFNLQNLLRENYCKENILKYLNIDVDSKGFISLVMQSAHRENDDYLVQWAKTIQVNAFVM